jgi:formiminoglutamase
MKEHILFMQSKQSCVPMKRTQIRMMRNLCAYDRNIVSSIVKVRPGETKVGQALQYLPNYESVEETSNSFSLRLDEVVSGGARYAIIGVPEDIGPRANMGRGKSKMLYLFAVRKYCHVYILYISFFLFSVFEGGANEAYSSFLKHFLNLQSNQYIKSNEILLIGHVECSDLQARSKNTTVVEELRDLCGELDDRVGSIMQPLFAAGLTPIVIGGGHNNCYPILKSLSMQRGSAVNAINLDPHADFRAIEGRHSGNGFSYAHKEGFLNKYHIMGLNELKNNQAILDLLAEAECTYDTYQSIFHRRNVSFEDSLATALRTVALDDFGIELDLDSITGMPVSAYNECGVSVNTAAHYVYQAARRPQSCYLHLCEAAPRHHPSGLPAGHEAVGQILASLASAFIQAKQEF